MWDDLRPPVITFGSEECDPRNLHYTMARNRDCYFHPVAAMALGNYFVWDFAEYNYNWHIESVEEMRDKEARYQLALLQKKINWRDHFFNAGLFNEQLSIRP